MHAASLAPGAGPISSSCKAQKFPCCCVGFQLSAGSRTRVKFAGGLECSNGRGEFRAEANDGRRSAHVDVYRHNG